MKRDTFWTVAAGVLFVSGLGSLYFANEHYQRKSEQAAFEASLFQDPTLPLDPAFEPTPNDELSFEAISTTTLLEGEPLIANIQHDGKGTIRFDASQDGDFTEFYLTPTKHIFCQSLECYSTEPESSESLFDISSYIYEPGDIADIGRGLIRTGDQTCPNLDTICQTWEAPAPVATQNLPVVLIEQESRNIVQISGVSGEDFVQIDFEYKDVDIILPINVEHLDSQTE